MSTVSDDPNPAFDAAGIGRDLLRTVRVGTLATLDRETGAPFATLVNVATGIDGSPLILLSRLAAHTQNLDADPRASLLLARPGRGDPLAHPRLTLEGTVATCDEPAALDRFLRRHPKAELYAGFADFGLRRLVLSGAHLNGGFARAGRLVPTDLLADLSDAADLVDREAGAVAHMNADHRDALTLYATALAGEPPGEWRTTGLDPDGIDLAAGDRTARVAFPLRVTSGTAVRDILVRLARDARAVNHTDA